MHWIDENASTGGGGRRVPLYVIYDGLLVLYTKVRPVLTCRYILLLESLQLECHFLPQQSFGIPCSHQLIVFLYKCFSTHSHVLIASFATICFDIRHHIVLSQYCPCFFLFFFFPPEISDFWADVAAFFFFYLIREW